jgi:hypothetical protein
MSPTAAAEAAVARPAITCTALPGPRYSSWTGPTLPGSFLSGNPSGASINLSFEGGGGPTPNATPTTVTGTARLVNGTPKRSRTSAPVMAQMSTVDSQLTAWASVCRCLLVSERTKASPRVEAGVDPRGDPVTGPMDEAAHEQCAQDEQDDLEAIAAQPDPEVAQRGDGRDKASRLHRGAHWITSVARSMPQCCSKGSGHATGNAGRKLTIEHCLASPAANVRLGCPAGGTPVRGNRRRVEGAREHDRGESRARAPARPRPRPAPRWPWPGVRGRRRRGRHRRARARR